MLDFVEANPKELYEQSIKSFQKLLGEPLLQGDERRIFLEGFIPILLGLKNDINFTGNQNLLKFASGNYLDAIGDMFNVYRFLANHAQTKAQFSLESPLTFDVIIPKGTRITGDGKLFFKTIEEHKITAGQTHTEVDVFAATSGKMPNGLTAGQVNAIVDLVPYITKVTNIENAFGGTDIEDDDGYRERIRISPERFSTAGPVGAYEFYALSASPLVKDVYVTSPTPGIVEVYIISKATVTPDEHLIKTVYNKLNVDMIRPLTDFVEVKSAVIKQYEVNITFYNTADSGIGDTQLELAVKECADDFVAQNKEKMGGAINPDKLKFAILKAGAYRVDITLPVYTPLKGNEVAVASKVKIAKSENS